MTWYVTGVRWRYSGNLPSRARPQLEFLEGRSSPSGLQPADLMGVVLADPLALSNAATADVAPPAAAAPPAASALPSVPVEALSTNSLAIALALPAPLSGAPEISAAQVPTVGVNHANSDQTHRIPEITLHASEGENGSWSFDGVVTADNPARLTVRFGGQGLPSLQNETTETNGDGTFDFTVRLQSGERGMATARTQDWSGVNSNVASDWVNPTNGPR